MKEEMESLREHNVWTMEELPKGVKPIKCKWVFQKKTNALGEVVRYKARLVAKGYSQQGVDYEDVYSPVSSFEIAVGVSTKWKIDQFDVKNAYLHATLNEVIYMEPPEGFLLRGKENMYCRLSKSFTG
ncbi:hypothetical protein M514_27697 [Trichuris suis]|uniref:Reverse transcriptase Ty1/copia-type domain-containing protein n=1 Tax=Trichuris suis TaxID=68888 RepID=A0A085MSC0_9BILA|nr:hypothetical protein M514_27697 [Trichuris suis]